MVKISVIVPNLQLRFLKKILNNNSNNNNTRDGLSAESIAAGKGLE